MPAPLRKTHVEYALEHLAGLGNAEEMQTNAARGQVHATLALVQATERLAEAQETANLIARNTAVIGFTLSGVPVTAETSAMVEQQAEEIAKRLKAYGV